MTHQMNDENTKNQDYLGGVIVFVAIITALFTVEYYPDSVSASTVALAINCTLLVPIYLNWVVKLLSDMEMYIGAVERISHYIERHNNKAHTDNHVDGNPDELMVTQPAEKCEYRCILFPSDIFLLFIALLDLVWILSC